MAKRSIIHISVPSSSGNSLQRKPAAPACSAIRISVPSSSGNSLQPAEEPPRERPQAISVPSSSGNSLQRIHTICTFKPGPHFSPLFIGELPSTPLPLPLPQYPLHFSPLFIGELPSTDRRRRRCHLLPVFQSPLHRGTPFNMKIEPDWYRYLFISVPSSSGNSLQPSASISAAPGCRNFSPLFIGELPSTPESMRTLESKSISVPSSSGNSLQPGPSVLLPTRSDYFSPLFIGELPSTILICGVVSRRPHFSPLFIGELPSTQGVEPILRSVQVFQSPLHRGTPFNSVTHTSSNGKGVISVPSSSGNSLQPPGSS